MGHRISAIIGDNQVNRDKIKEFGLAAAFEDSFVIVILDLYAMCELSEILNKSTDSYSEHPDWDCELTHFMAKEIGLKQFVLIETDYFGGIGEQFASYYDNGKKVLHEVRINEALAYLGVQPKADLDAFDTLNLSEYRNSEYYYWEQDNRAAGKENMIAGRVLNR